MEKRNIPRNIMILAGIVLALCLAACAREPVIPPPSEPQSIEYSPEVPEPVTNDP